MSATVAVYATLSIQSYLYFLGKSHFGNIYIYNKLIAYVTRKSIRQISIVSSQHSTIWKCFNKTIIEANQKKFGYFPRSFDVIGQFMKNVAFFCSQLALRLVNFLPSGPVRVAAL